MISRYDVIRAFEMADKKGEKLAMYLSEDKKSLMDTKTGSSVSVAHDGWACGRQNQLYGFYCESGTLPTLSNFCVYGANNPDIHKNLRSLCCGGFFSLSVMISKLFTRSSH